MFGIDKLEAKNKRLDKVERQNRSELNGLPYSLHTGFREPQTDSKMDQSTDIFTHAQVLPQKVTQSRE